MKIHEIIEKLQQFPQEAEIEIVHLEQITKGFVSYHCYETDADHIEGNTEDPREAEVVTVWIKPTPRKNEQHQR